MERVVFILIIGVLAFMLLYPRTSDDEFVGPVKKTECKECDLEKKTPQKTCSTGMCSRRNGFNF